MNDISDLRFTTVPKSDQLNADQLVGGSMTITVTGVRLVESAQQPLVVNYEGDGGRPFKPCLTMRRVMTHEAAWGPDGRKWIGRSLTIYNDPAVKFGTDTTGGVRISHMSHLKNDLELRLQVSKGKRVLYRIRRMVDGDSELIAAIKSAADVESLKAAFAAAYKNTKDEERRAAFKAEYDRRTQELAPSSQLQDFVAKVKAAPNSDDGAAIVGSAREVLKPAELAELNKAYADRFDQGAEALQPTGKDGAAQVPAVQPTVGPGR